MAARITAAMMLAISSQLGPGGISCTGIAGAGGSAGNTGAPVTIGVGGAVVATEGGTTGEGGMAGAMVGVGVGIAGFGVTGGCSGCLDGGRGGGVWPRWVDGSTVGIGAGATTVIIRAKTVKWLTWAETVLATGSTVDSRVTHLVLSQKAITRFLAPGGTGGDT